MKQYWPMATYKKTDGLPGVNKLFTYDSCFTIAEAKTVISKWANACGYHLTSAWIDCELDGNKRRITLFEDDSKRRKVE